MPPAHAVTFLDNHDTQRAGAPLTYQRDGALYILATVFMLATPYGFPKVMSSYAFQDKDAGPPTTDASTHCGGDDATWLCEHRIPAISNMVAFRKISQGAAVAHFLSDGPDRVAFAREGKVPNPKIRIGVLGFRV
jgi:alpha-amylase